MDANEVAAALAADRAVRDVIEGLARGTLTMAAAEERIKAVKAFPRGPRVTLAALARAEVTGDDVDPAADRYVAVDEAVRKREITQEQRDRLVRAGR